MFIFARRCLSYPADATVGGESEWTFSVDERCEAGFQSPRGLGRLGKDKATREDAGWSLFGAGEVEVGITDADEAGSAAGL